jgi:DNA-binding transcriptional LysR family regulator
LERTERALHYLKEIEDSLIRIVGHKLPIVSRVTANQLRAVIEVCKQSSYSRAALTLGLSQPYVHKAARSFETLCGTTLFKRTPHGVEPSWLAQQIATRASLFFSELEQGRDELREHIGIIDGNLRIGALPLARASIIPRTVTEIIQRHPSAQISIVDGPYEEQLNQLLRGELDLIIGALRRPHPSPNVVQETLFSDQLHLVTGTSHPLANQSINDPTMLQKLDWLAPKKGTPARAAFSNYFQEAGLPQPKRIVECSSLVAIRGLLMESDFAALLPAQQVSTDVKMGALAISGLEISGTRREIGLTYRKNWIPTALQRAFLETTRKERSAKQIPEKKRPTSKSV